MDVQPFSSCERGRRAEASQRRAGSTWRIPERSPQDVPCAEAGAEFGYERVPIGTRFVFRRVDPFSVAHSSATADNGRQRPESLTENDRRILEFLRSHGTSPTALVSEELGIPARTARTALRRLADADLIERLGADRNRTYRAI